MESSISSSSSFCCLILILVVVLIMQNTRGRSRRRRYDGRTSDISSESIFSDSSDTRKYQSTN